jgi:hypothetical protein
LILCRDDDTDETVVVSILKRLRNFVDASRDFMSELDIDPRRPILEAISRTQNVLQCIGSWTALKACLLWQKKLLKLTEDKVISERQIFILRDAETSFRMCSKILSRKV